MRVAYNGCNFESGTLLPSSLHDESAQVFSEILTYSLWLGPGSDRRRKDIMNAALADRELFTKLLTDTKTIFKTHASSLQGEVQAAITKFLRAVKKAFDLVRDENVARESERDPEFRLRVETSAKTSQEQLRGLLDIVL